MTTTLLLKTTLITCTSVSTSHNSGIILWEDSLDEARVEVDKLLEYVDGGVGEEGSGMFLLD